MNNIYLFLPIFLLFSNSIFAQAAYFVSPTGSDDNSGSIEAPLASIEKALTLGLNQEQSIHIYLRTGIYEIKNTIELHGIHRNVSISSYQKEKVILTGGKFLNPEKVQAVKDSDYEYLFKKSSLGNIFMIDLQEAGISEYGQLKTVGFAKEYKIAGMEFFKDENAMQLARWPNDSTILVSDLLDAGLFPKKENDISRGGKIKYDILDFPQWNELADVWIEGYFHHGYAMDAVKIKDINFEEKIITTTHPHIYGFMSGQPWNRFYAYNIPSELDQENEYYIDRKKGILFFHQNKKANSLEVSILEKPFFSIINSKEIKLEQLTFQSARGIGIYMENSNNCHIKKCTFKNLGSLAIVIGKPFIADKNSINHHNILGHYPERYSSDVNKCDEGKKNKIEHCKIFQTGAGGVYLSGGNRYDLTAANNEINHCEIFNFNRIEKSYRPAIRIAGVGNKIAHCNIYNGISQAILLSGNNHIIEYNDIHDVCLEVDDAGALYYGRNPSERGTIVRHNYFHHIGEDNPYQTSAIYHDDGSCGMEVYGNIFLKAGSIAAFLGGGQDISYHNNLFIDCLTGLHIDDRLNNWASSFLLPNGNFEQKLQLISYNQPPYSIQYPHLAQYWKDNPSQPKRNVISSNIFCDMGSLSSTGTFLFDWKEDNVMASGFPSIWEKEMDNRDFIPNDMYLPRPSNWKEIEKNKIGIQGVKE